MDPPTPFSSPALKEDFESLTPGGQAIVISFARETSTVLKGLIAPHHQPWTFDMNTHPLAANFTRHPQEIGWHRYHAAHHTFLRGWFVDSGLAEWIAYHRKSAYIEIHTKVSVTAPTVPDARLVGKESYQVEAALCLVTLAFNYGVLNFRNGIYAFENFTGEPMALVHELISNSVFEHALETKLLESIGKCHAEIVKGITPGTLLPDLTRCLPIFHADPKKFGELPCNDVVKAAIESYEEWIPAFDEFQKKLDDSQTEEEKREADRKWEEMKTANGWKGKSSEEKSTSGTGTAGASGSDVAKAVQEGRCCGGH